MEQVFDFREFTIYLWRRCKVILALALILAIAGGAYGYFVRSREVSDGIKDTYTVTSAVSVNTTSEETALASSMSTVDAVLSSDYFFDGLLKFLTSGEYIDCAKLFNDPATATVADMKSAAKVSIKGNLIFFEVTTEDPALSERVAAAANERIVWVINNNISNLNAEALSRRMTSTNTAVAVSRAKIGLKFAIFGGVAGIGIGVLFYAFFNIFSLRVDTAQDLKKYGVPVLAEAGRK